MILVQYTLLWLFALSQVNSSPLDFKAGDKNYFQLDDVILLDDKFKQKGFNGNWVSGTEFIYNKPGIKAIYKYDIVTKTESIYVSEAILNKLNTTSVEESPDGKLFLADFDHQSGFRYSSLARYTLYDVENSAVYPVANHTLLQYCTFGETNHSIVFVLENDVYYLHDIISNDKAVRLTIDGKPGVIYNGVPDWVYEEEVFGSSSALWFSNNGSRLAIASFNDTEVDVVSYTTYGEPNGFPAQYPTTHELRYPKAGSKNPTVSLKVINLKNPNGKLVDLGAPTEVGRDHILGSVTWASDDEVAALWLNRRQNTSVLVICNADTGACKNEIVRRQPKGWIEVSTPIFNGNEILDVVFRPQGRNNTNEWMHLVRYVRGINEVVDISSGNRTVTNIVGWNIELDKIYYLSTLENEPWQKHLWVGGSESKCISCGLKLFDGKPCRFVSTSSFSVKSQAYSLSCQGESPVKIWIYNATNDEPILIWEENMNVITNLEKYWMPNQINLRVPVPGGFRAAVKLFLPPQLKFPDDKGSYPMVVNIYTGPNSARVLDTFSISYQTYMATTRSIIYCLIDGRGSGLKGKDMLFSVNNKLGNLEVEDIINVTKHLADNYSWIDRKNIGLWGWSYGGYATAMALTKDDNFVFKCGISVAPVTSWLYYDTIYTERFMGTPQDNPEGYAEGDVNRRANFFNGRRFLMIHGVADDNVHYQNAMSLARLLQRLEIQFEQMSYPDEAHGLSGVTPHVYHLIDSFWTKCFASQNSVVR